MPGDLLGALEHQVAQPSVVCKGPTWDSAMERGGQPAIPAFILLMNKVN